MRLPHTPDGVSSLRAADASEPLRVLVSGCMLGQPVGVDGTDYGMGGVLDEHKYQKGVGVATALLLRDGIPVVSQRDFRTLERIRAHLDPTHHPDPEALDHHQTDWCREYFGPEA